MAGTDESDDSRLTGRMRRARRRRVDDTRAVDGDAGDGEPGPDDHEIEAVTKLMGFLRDSDDR